MNKKKSQVKKYKKSEVIFTVKSEETQKTIEVYKSSELNTYNLSSFSFISKNNSFMSRLEEAEKRFDEKFDICISK